MNEGRPVLVAFASAHGQTRRIAERLAARLRERGLEVDLRDLAELPEGFSLHDYAGALLGAPVHAGHHLREAVDFARHHETSLAAMPAGFFSVSLTAADSDEESRAATRGCIDLFVEETGWDPHLRVSLAGALLLSHYGVFERAIMRLIAQRAGHGDVDWDQEYTDWEAVDALADDFARELSRGQPGA